ncbi:MAG: glycoside hydrolase family 13 domain protein [Gemmatimonadetes bacterium]|nr:glycoside hydrolase family 13 domain protein [Gemmatimonadota bacterium]
MRLIPLAGFALIAVVPAVPVTAQGTSRLSSALDVGALVQHDGLDQWQSATRLAPSLRFDQRWVQVGADGSVQGSARGLMLDHGLIQAALAPAPLGPFRWTANTRAEHLASPTYQARTVLTGESSLSLALGNSGAWVGAALERSPQIDTLPTMLLSRFGVWRRIGGAMVTLSSSSHALRTGGRASTLRSESYADSILVRNDTLHTQSYIHTIRTRIAGDSAQASKTQVWSDVQLGASWAHGPVALDAAFGARRSVSTFPRALWTRITADVQVSPALAVIASGGNDPAQIALGIPSTRVASLGIRVSSISSLRPTRASPVRATAAAFSLRPAGQNTYVVTIRVPRARTVELSGDFGQWKAIALVETHPDVWETTLALPAGTYRMNLRIDGDQWKAPPDLPVVADEFNGTVGIVVVH